MANRYEIRLPVWLRVLVVLAAGCGALLCGQQVVASYGATMEYRDAPVCAAGSRAEHGGGGDECVRREAGTVLGRRSGELCTFDSSGGVDGSGGGTTCRPYHQLRVEWPGRADWLSVSLAMYDAAEKGDRAAVRLWRGDVVELRTDGRTRTYEPPSQSGLLLWTALGGLILTTGAWAGARGRL